MSPSLWSWRSCFTSKDLSSFTEFITREGMPVVPNPQSVDSSDPRPVWNGATQQEVSSGWVNEPSFFSCSLITLINAWTIISFAPIHGKLPWNWSLVLKWLGIAGACQSFSEPWAEAGAVWAGGSALSSTAALTGGILGKTLVPQFTRGALPLSDLINHLNKCFFIEGTLQPK